MTGWAGINALAGDRFAAFSTKPFCRHTSPDVDENKHQDSADDGTDRTGDGTDKREQEGTNLNEAPFTECEAFFYAFCQVLRIL